MPDYRTTCYFWLLLAFDQLQATHRTRVHDLVSVSTVDGLVVPPLEPVFCSILPRSCRGLEIAFAFLEALWISILTLMEEVRIWPLVQDLFSSQTRLAPADTFTSPTDHSVQWQSVSLCVC